jgi:DNA invertase Pin-like site-specific DNA recombinase
LAIVSRIFARTLYLGQWWFLHGNLAKLWKMTMSVFGYIFSALDKEQQVTVEEQQDALNDYARSIGLPIEDIFIEDGATLKKPFKERTAGGRLMGRCIAGDAIITMKAAWILSSAGDGVSLLQALRKKNIAMHCVDLGDNISVDEKRKLVVYEGCAGIVQKLLSALAVCESSSHGEAIRATKRTLKKKGKYIGGPVPFGWEVNDKRVLVHNKEQQKIITTIAAWREDRWSYRDISRKLKDEYNVQLSHAGVRRILDNDRNKKQEMAEEPRKE